MRNVIKITSRPTSQAEISVGMWQPVLVILVLHIGLSSGFRPYPVLRIWKSCKVWAKNVESSYKQYEFDVGHFYSGKEAAGFKQGSSHYSVAGMSLRDISREYGFSKDYLGDFLAQVGVSTPIDVTEKLGKIMTGSQLFSLLHAINSLDPSETSDAYGNVDMTELAKGYDLTAKNIKYICKKEGINLPFGMDTILHDSLILKFEQAMEYGDYDQSSGEEYESNMPDMNDIINKMKTEPK